MSNKVLQDKLLAVAKEKNYYTLDEIRDQYLLWQDTFTLYQRQKMAIKSFIANIINKHGRVHVIFTGAGTSNYVGDVLLPYVQYKNKNLHFSSIPTTDLVSNPRQFFNNEEACLLVSFARSGNSPESVAAVQLGKQVVPNFYQLNITCAKEGKLALNSQNDDKAYLFLLNEKCNDRGFAMTSSYTSMTLSGLLIFGQDEEEKQIEYVDTIVEMAKDVNGRLNEVLAVLDEGIKRVVYLGSGSLGKLTREAQLKILELTAGRLTTCFDSSMGFRHGPKSFLNNETLVVDFISNDEYTRKYDLDILREIINDDEAHTVYTTGSLDYGVMSFSQTQAKVINKAFIFNKGANLPDAYLALPNILIAQYLAAYAAIMVDNHVDSPSAKGTVNRVVQGVIIHDLPALS